MALSNWDTLAVDATGAVADGTFAAARGDLSVAIYKNWLYVRSPSMWQKESSSFVEPTIAEIQEGEVRLGNVNIYAARGPSEGVYCCVWESIYRPDLPSLTRCMAGIGIYGFKGEEWVGIEPAHVQHLEELIRLGVAVGPLPREFLELELSEGRRFNQGDAYFAGQFGVETPSAAPGESGRPLLDDALQGFQRNLDALDEGNPGDGSGLDLD